MRSQWTDKATGKVINLSNYAYSQMSGWNGYAYDWKTWISNDVTGTGSVLTKTGSKVHVTYLGNHPQWAIIYKQNETFRSERIRISGLKDGARILYGRVLNQGDAYTYITLTNGVNVINGDDVTYYQLSLAIQGYSANEACDITIEQLPLYPGALVSDGVDDQGVTAENINVEVGTLICMAESVESKVSYIIDSRSSEDTSAGLYIYRDGSSVFRIRQSMITSTAKEPFFIGTRIPVATGANLNLTKRFDGGEYGAYALYRLIFIKEQLDAAQLEFLTWKVDKEYRDWLKEKGYNYAISEMLNN